MSDNVEDNESGATAFDVSLDEVQEEVRSREYRVDEYARRVDSIRYELAQQRSGLPRICNAGVARMFEARRRMLRAELKAAESKMAEAEAVLKRARQREAEMKSERAEIGAAAIEEGAE